ncbi:MAG TPA: transcription termination factor NusA [Firmicutes bacterium]|nr:transcription termination factor NusA [Bacillota bacterium]
MNTEFFEALTMLEKEKGIPADYLLEKIKNAITIAVKRDYEGAEEVRVDIEPDKEIFEVAVGKEAVEEVFDPKIEILLEDARKIDPQAELESIVFVPLQTKEFGRIAAQTAKHVIRQGIREAERGQAFQKFQKHDQEIVSARVMKLDPRRGGITVEIDGSEAYLLKSEQVPGEIYKEGDIIKVYVVGVSETDRGPRIMISRTHPGLVKRLFENEVPEIYDGLIEVKSISREAGSRTKIAVWSKDENVDAVGACIGPKGIRVAKIVEELGGEKIDVVKYSEEPEQFIAAALSPADVLEVTILDEEAHSCRVIVPDTQLSLAIGNKGQNARLAARLTGYKIDIKSESDPIDEETEAPVAEENTVQEDNGETSPSVSPIE